MTQQNLSRRTLAKGAAWSVPLAAASASVPALAASQPGADPSDPCLTKDEVQGPKINCARILQAFNSFTGLRDYATSFGGWANANLQYSITVRATCWPNAQPMEVNTYAGGSFNHQVPRPYVVLPRAEGKRFTGRSTLGNRAQSGARAGIPLSGTIQWSKSDGSDSLDWTGAQVTIPLEFNWSDHGDHTCIFDLKFDLSGGWTGLLASRKPMTNYRLVLHAE